MAPLAPGSHSLIVVVGITGYIASQTGLQALKAGYRVRGTVRNKAKAEELRAAYAKEGADVSPENLEFVDLDDLLSEAQFEAAFTGADGVIHPALPDLTGEDAVNEIIQSTLIPLRAATKAGIKRFVLTGTLVSVITPGPKVPTDRLITDKDWNDEAVEAWKNASEETKKSPAFVGLKYMAGKVLGERAGWKYMETESPPFEFTVVLPAQTWGPKVYGTTSTSLGWLAGLLNNDATGALTRSPIYVEDVRDAAKLHILSLYEPETAGRRIWAAGHPVGWHQVLEILRKHFPNEAIPKDPPASPLDPCPWRIDMALEVKLLGGKWIDLETCMVDAAKSLGYTDAI
ncbi:NAD(P)-binding protein [Calocera cornea HHB12733]|uniref:NAD(P)-binding protein n=1 Tax=Calocera cornea HHB12733 TaxID=1353952 RepID=A0A165GYZ2_9BASI|nr:NAD(P)-binding protein [Calocera cornea HHB12733]